MDVNVNVLCSENMYTKCAVYVYSTYGFNLPSRIFLFSFHSPYVCTIRGSGLAGMVDRQFSSLIPRPFAGGRQVFALHILGELVNARYQYDHDMDPCSIMGAWGQEHRKL